MKRGLIGVLAVALVLAFSFNLALAGAYEDLIQQGDALYEQRGDINKAKEAVETYRKAVAGEQTKAEGFWKLSRALYYYGDNISDGKMKLFEEAIEAGKKAVAIDANSVDGYYYLGLNYGLYGQTKGVLKSLALVGPIKETMNEVIKRDPGYASGGAYRVLGRLYFKIPGFAGGDNDKAIENLETAMKYGPKSWITHQFLAEIYMDKGDYAKAKELLTQVVEGECQAADGPACANKWKPDAQKLLAECDAKMK
jgi:tetratricopeptide (TPR) repeat protein